MLLYKINMIFLLFNNKRIILRELLYRFKICKNKMCLYIFYVLNYLIGKYLFIFYLLYVFINYYFDEIEFNFLKVLC